MASNRGVKFDEWVSRLGRATGLALFAVASVAALKGVEVNPLIFTGSLSLYGLVKLTDVVSAIRKTSDHGPPPHEGHPASDQ
jgi:uncharacterized membrane protein (DUF441 family)